VHRRGAGDPTFQRAPDGTIWRACRTPDGPVTARILHRPSDGKFGTVLFEAWGPGATWWCANGPDFLGASDEVSGFVPSNPDVARSWSRDPHWRISRSHLVLEALVAAAVEQKVTGREARSGWRALLRRFGEPAPGPGAACGMRVLPAPERLAAIPSWEWLRCHIDGARSAVIVRAAQRATALERTLRLPSAAADTALCSLPGVGAWTSAEVRQRAHGDPDAVSFGDYHIAGHVTYALTGAKGDDDDLRELLEPDRPHRYRIQHIVTTRMRGPERRGPRMALRSHLPAASS
jgi:3-methyladenine DNA glycosylase/8-oxoguanine DNA glycosylase